MRLKRISFRMKFLAPVLLLIGGVVHASCLEDIRGRGVVTAGTGFMGVKPSLWQAEDGSSHGFARDILRANASRLGSPQHRVIPTEWASLIPRPTTRPRDILLSDPE